MSRYVPDGRGGVWLEQGSSWTSGGVPHGNLSRTRDRSTPGVEMPQTDPVFDNRSNGSAAGAEPATLP